MTRIVLVLAASAAALALLFVGISPAPATRPVDREKSLKIFIVCDSEGGSGIVEYWSRNVPPGHPRFQEYRELMTRDINAAIEGCFQAGATEVVVSDYLQQLDKGAESPVSRLTARQAEVLKLMVDGQSNRAIAEALNVSVKTVESHRQQIMVKLGVRSTAELTKYAIRAGLTSL